MTVRQTITREQRSIILGVDIFDPCLMLTAVTTAASHQVTALARKNEANDVAQDNEHDTQGGKQGGKKDRQLALQLGENRRRWRDDLHSRLGFQKVFLIFHNRESLPQDRSKCKSPFRPPFRPRGLCAGLIVMGLLGGPPASQAIDREQLIEHNRHIERLIQQKSVPGGQGAVPSAPPESVQQSLPPVREVLTVPARTAPVETADIVSRELETLQRKHRALEEHVLRLQMTVSQRISDTPSAVTSSTLGPTTHTGPTGGCRDQSLVAGTLLSNLTRILDNCRRTLGHWPLIEADNVVVDFRIPTPPALPAPGGLDQLFEWMRDTYGIVPASPDSRPGDVIRFVERAALTPVAVPTVVQATPTIQSVRPETRTGTVKHRFDEAERAK